MAAFLAKSAPLCAFGCVSGGLREGGAPHTAGPPARSPEWGCGSLAALGARGSCVDLRCSAGPRVLGRSAPSSARPAPEPQNQLRHKNPRPKHRKLPKSVRASSARLGQTPQGPPPSFRTSGQPRVTPCPTSHRERPERTPKRTLRGAVCAEPPQRSEPGGTLPEMASVDILGHAGGATCSARSTSSKASKQLRPTCLQTARSKGSTLWCPRV